MPKIPDKLKPVSTPARAFLTGSRVYGIPRKDSDIDLVVLLDKKEYYKLSDFSTNFNPSDHPSASDEEACPSLRFGALNIVPVFEPELFDAWKEGTEFLKGEAPVNKNRACEVLEEFRMKAKLRVKQRRKEVGKKDA